MSISVTPNVPVIAAQGVASDLVLQPGAGRQNVAPCGDEV